MLKNKKKIGGDPFFLSVARALLDTGHQIKLITFSAINQKAIK